MSPIRTRLAVGVATLGVVATPVAIAQAGDGGHHGATHDPAPAPAPAPVDAATFVAKATQSNTFEVVSSRLALERSRHHAVRMIAERLIRDHTQAQAQLVATAAQVGIPVPKPNLSPEQQAIVAELKRLWGRDFDAAYLRAQVAAHEQAIALFVGFASQDDEPRPLRLLALRTLPVLGQHLGQVRAALDGWHGDHA
jgi:putative membrane protein